MRFNPLPFFFAPGIALAGYLIGGLSGAQNALAGFALLIGAASVLILARGPDDDRSSPTAGR